MPSGVTTRRAPDCSNPVCPRDSSKQGTNFLRQIFYAEASINPSGFVGLGNRHPTFFPRQMSNGISWSCMPVGKKPWFKERRSLRIKWDASVVVHRPPKEGPQFNERTQTLSVSAHGALIALTGQVVPKQRLLIQNAGSGEQQECRVVSVENDLTGPTKVAVEFVRPAPCFWRIAYPPADWNVK